MENLLYIGMIKLAIVQIDINFADNKIGLTNALDIFLLLQVCISIRAVRAW